LLWVFVFPSSPPYKKPLRLQSERIQHIVLLLTSSVLLLAHRLLGTPASLLLVPIASMDGRHATTGGLLERSEAKGYERGVHKDEDEVPDARKYIEEIKKDQDAALRRCILQMISAF
jgi:hypothetical protein